jgi:hypothetical protein
MSTNRTQPGGRLGRTAARGPNGRGICRRCGVEVPKGRHTFCGEACVSAWRLRTDPGYLREQVFARDRGICCRCSLDTVEFYRRLQRLPAGRRRRLGRALDFPRSRKSFWDADHILAVAEGGGECDLDNLRTLCLWCHMEATAELRKRLRKERIARRALAKIRVK